VVHDAHGYSTWDRVAPTGSVLFSPPSQSSLLTGSVLKGRTVIGLYFSADWCTPRQAFTPLLKHLYSCKRAHCTETNRNIPLFEVVLVSRCRDTRASELYFSTMPWSAMLHAEATGARGLALRVKFAITTIPALVLLDGVGVVLCWNAHERLQDDPLGKHFPWQSTPAAPRIPQVDFDIVAHSRPDVASLGIPLQRPPGKPPPFGTVRTDSVPDPGDQGSSRQHRQTHDKGRGKSSLVGSQVGASDVSRVGSQVGQEPGPQPAPRAGPTPAPTASTSKRKTAASENVPRPRPPPKPGAHSSPSIASRAIQALAATAATSHNMFFFPTSVTHHKDGKEPISAKKLVAGDGNFDTKKEIIGFVFDRVKRTVHLPPAKAAAYIKETHTLLQRKAVPLKNLQRLVGKLRHASIILPAAKGFFSPLNDAMRGSPKPHWPWRRLRGQAGTRGPDLPHAPPELATYSRQGASTGCSPSCKLSRWGG
jgi:thiol-disulfide isomerase/thioredoxin